MGTFLSYLLISLGIMRVRMILDCPSEANWGGEGQMKGSDIGIEFDIDDATMFWGA
jgi:hypothetical protein